MTKGGKRGKRGKRGGGGGLEDPLMEPTTAPPLGEEWVTPFRFTTDFWEKVAILLILVMAGVVVVVLLRGIESGWGLVRVKPWPFEGLCNMPPKEQENEDKQDKN